MVLKFLKCGSILPIPIQGSIYRNRNMYQWICLISWNAVELYDEIDLLLFNVKWKVFQFYSWWNQIYKHKFVCLMVFNATFNNISVISWWSVLLVEETEGPWKTTDLSQVTNKLYYHIMLYTSPWTRFELTTSVVIGTGCIGSCKSNYHTITATTA